jgi:hypothetical protein
MPMMPLTVNRSVGYNMTVLSGSKMAMKTKLPNVTIKPMPYIQR